MMTRIERLLEQIEHVETMLNARLCAVRYAHINALLYQIEMLHQRVSLAEKKQRVKNERSPDTSV